MDVVVEERTKEEKKGEIMKRRMELEQARKRDNTNTNNGVNTLLLYA